MNGAFDNTSSICERKSLAGFSSSILTQRYEKETSVRLIAPEPMVPDVRWAIREHDGSTWELFVDLVEHT